MNFDLAFVGNGSHTHVLESNERVLCENAYGGNYQHASGEPSVIEPTGKQGKPSCYWCKRVIAKVGATA